MTKTTQQLAGSPQPGTDGPAAGSIPMHSGTQHLWTRRDFLAGSTVALAAATCLPRIHGEVATQAGPPQFPLAAHREDSFAAFLAYRPDKDPDAPFFRSWLPRAPRIEPLRATQAHPALDPKPQLASLTGCYRMLGAAPTDVYKTQRHGTPPPGGVYVSRMVGSHDILVSWSGPGIVPNPAMTDAAHRNGALCLGLVFQPDHRMYDGSVVPAQQTAARLVELARYFGFDGYFVNFENGTKAQHAQVLAWIAGMHAEAQHRGLQEFYIQFYDGSADMAQLLPVRSPQAPGVSYADSVMLDQGWSGYSMTHGCCSGLPTSAATVAAYCTQHGFDPFRSAFFGFQLYPGPGYLGLAAPAVITPNTAAAACGSLQIYSWDDGLYNLEAFAHPQAAPPEREAAFYHLERLFFMGQSGDPANDNAPTPAQAALYADVAGGTRRYTDVSGEPRAASHIEDQARLPITYGVRNFVTERSVVGSLPLLTRFNVGSGTGFWLEGEPVSRDAWFHLGAQDLLPTWQWWQSPTETAAANFTQPAPLTIEYDRSTAWNGGASLRFAGVSPAGGVTVRLFATNLRLPRGTCLQMVWKADATTKVRSGLIFADAPQTPVWVEAASVEPAGAGWVRATVLLDAYRGRTMVTLALGLAGESAVELLLGELYLGPRAQRGAARMPKGLRAETQRSQGDSVSARLRWHLDPEVLYYDVFALDDDGKHWLGRIYADCWYAETVPARGALRFGLTAVSREAPLVTSPMAQTHPRVLPG